MIIVKEGVCHMLLKLIGAILIAIVATTAIVKPHNQRHDGVTVVAWCPQEDDLWEHVERCTVDVQPNR